MIDPLELAEDVLRVHKQEDREEILAAEVIRLSERLSIATTLIHEMYVHISGPSTERCVSCDEEATEFLNSHIEV